MMLILSWRYYCDGADDVIILMLDRGQGTSASSKALGGLWLTVHQTTRENGAGLTLTCKCSLESTTSEYHTSNLASQWTGMTMPEVGRIPETCLNVVSLVHPLQETLSGKPVVNCTPDDTRGWFGLTSMRARR